MLTHTKNAITTTTTTATSKLNEGMKSAQHSYIRNLWNRPTFYSSTNNTNNNNKHHSNNINANEQPENWFHIAIIDLFFSGCCCLQWATQTKIKREQIKCDLLRSVIEWIGWAHFAFYHKRFPKPKGTKKKQQNSMFLCRCIDVVPFLSLSLYVNSYEHCLRVFDLILCKDFNNIQRN